MRKLTKKVLSLVLCVMLVFSAFSAIAETVGTTTVPGKGWVVYDAPVGLELNGDMSTWLGNDISPSGNPLLTSADGVLRAGDGMLDVSTFAEVGPARFKIPGAVNGTKVKISFDYNINLDDLATDALKAQAKTERLTSYMFRLYNADGSTNTEGGRDLWHTDGGSTISKEFTMTDSNQFFRIIFGSCRSCRAAWSITNIKVEVTHPADEDTIGKTTLSNGWVVYDEPVDLELDGDMSSWLGNNISPSKKPLFSSENGVLKADDGMLDVSTFAEVGPARFKIPNAVEGTKVKLSFDYNINLDDLATDALKAQAKTERLTSYVLRLYNADGSASSEQKADLWYDDAGTISAEFTITDPDQFFRIIFGSCRSCRAAWSITNIKVEVTHPEVEEETVGTTTLPNGWVVYDAPVGLTLNGDLSTWLGAVSASGTPVYVSENGVLKAADGMLEVGAWAEVGPARFKIPNVEKGSTVKLSFDYNVNLDDLATDALKTQAQGERLTSYVFRLYNADGTKNTESGKDLWYYDSGKTISAEFTVTDPDQFFRIIIGSCKSCRAAWSITNIKVEVTPPEEEYVELEFDESDAESYYGTAEGGFNSQYTSSYPVKLKPIEGVPALDFEAGFIYWSGRNAATGAGTLAADSFKLAAEGENIYLTLYKDGYVDSAQTAFIKVSDLKTGDKVALIYNAKGEDATKLRAYLKQDALRAVEYGTDGICTTLNPNGNGNVWNPSGGSPKTIIQSTATLNPFAVQTGAEGWTTYVTDVGTILDPSGIGTSDASSDIFLQVVVGKVASAGNALDAAIDDIIIAKVVDGAYYNLATGEKIYDVNDAPADAIPGYYGTEEDGFNSLNTSSYPQNLKPIDGPANLDFSDGFIYWSGRNAGNAPYTGSFASDSFKLVADGDNKYITLRDDGFVDTMRTVLIKASNVAPGDQLAVIYDAKGEDVNKLRVTLNQEHIRGNHVSYDPITGLNTTGNKPSPGTTNILVSNHAPRTALEELPAPTGWTPYATGTTAEVNDPATVNSSIPCTSDIYLQVVIDRAPSVNPGDKLDAAIDNIRIVKIVDEVYYDINTNQPIARVVEHEEPEVNATHLTDLVTAILTDTTTVELDYNGDGNVDLLDVVYLKKWLADIL